MFSTQSLIKLSLNQKSLSNKNNLNSSGQKIFIYKSAIKLENLQKAFKRLKVSSSIPGIDSCIKATFKSQLGKSLEKLHRELKNQKYKPSPISVVYLVKSNGSKRPLGISSVRDKIVQAVFYEELAAVYESIFYDCSYGFRPKKSCHSALKQIKKKWQSVKWFISLDIEKMFEKVQHNILIEILQKQINDQETLNLIQKFLNVGYVDIHNLTNRERYKQESIPLGVRVCIFGNFWIITVYFSIIIPITQPVGSSNR